MRRITRPAAVLAAGLLLLTAGCARSWPMNDQVEGVVKLDGKPLANATIQFVPDIDPKVQAPTSTGTTDAQGRFTLTCDTQKPGAVVGKHNVLVLVGRGETEDLSGAPEAKAAARSAVPTCYMTAAQTPLQVEVTADKHSYELAVYTTATPRTAAKR